MVALQARQNQRLAPTEFAAPVFGIKAKLDAVDDSGSAEFAAPVFGIKAKLAIGASLTFIEFAAPVFGIKAKQSISR